MACAAINLYFSGTYFYGFTAFFTPLVDDFGWSYATISLALALRSAETGLFSPFLGFLVDRFGPRKLMVTGSLLAGIGAVLLSQVNSLGTFYGAIMLLAVGASACSGTVASMTAVANWFDKKIGKAAALVTVGFGLGGLLVPLLVWFIDGCGWRPSIMLIGIGMSVICLPLALMVRHRPEQYGYLPDGEPRAPSEGWSTEVGMTEPPAVEHTAKEALKTRAFWILVSITFLGLLPVAAIIVHVIPYLESVGFAREKAGLVVTAMSALTIVGRFGFGWLADVWDKRKLLIITFILEALGVLIFAYMRNIWLLIPFVLTFSIAQGGQATLRIAIQREFFGRSSFGGIQGLTMIGATTAFIVAPPIAGRVFDVTQSYYPTWLALALVSAIGVPVTLLMKQLSKREARSAENHL